MNLFDILETTRPRNYDLFLKKHVICVYAHTVPRLKKVKVDISYF